MAESHDQVLVGQLLVNTRFRFIGIAVLLDQRHRRFVGTTMQRTAQRADGARNRRVHIGQSASDDATRESRCIELMLRVGE